MNYLFCFCCIIMASCTVKKSQQTEPTITLTGTFESQKGVMTPLSCYCFNSGMLTASDGKKINICFGENDKEISCKTISVTGFYKTVKNSPEQTSPCPKGEMTYFSVVNFKCL